MRINRRQFVRTSGAAISAVGLTGIGSAQQPVSPQPEPQDPSATKDIRVAVIGVRGRGINHLQGMPGNIVAVCDADRKMLTVRSQEASKQLKRQVAAFSDYRKLLEDPTIDAVSIATPNHWHSLMAIAACEAGKDVYVEKPISHNVWEGRQLVAAAKRYGRIVQCGTQARSSVAIKNAIEYLQSGKLGAIQYAIATCYKPRRSIGMLDHPLDIPPHIDFDLWCGPAEKKDIYRPSLHYDWHWDFNTGCGDVGNQGVHQIDIARWILGEPGLPRRVVTIGGRVGYLDAGETANTQITYFDYEKAPLIFECRGLPKSKEHRNKWEESMDTYRSSQVGVIVQCEKGYLHVPNNYAQVFVFDNEDEQIDKLSNDLPSHYDNWLQAVAAKDASQLSGKILEGHISSALCHLANISYQTGERKPIQEIESELSAVKVGDPMMDAMQRMKQHLLANEINLEKANPLISGTLLTVDAAHERFVDNELANELLRRTYRDEFVVPEISTSGIAAS